MLMRSGAPAKKRVLITGGAGFIGSHVADELLTQGHSVRVLDVLCSEVHGADMTRAPTYLNPDVELIIGDVGNPETVCRALRNIDVVIHLAARVGVQQSLDQMPLFTLSNSLGTAMLLRELVARPVERIVVASSMSIYGEGAYRHPDGTIVTPPARTLEQLEAKRWDPLTADGEILVPQPTPETAVPSPASIYAMTKLDQEWMCLIAGRSCSIPTVALRLFNVFGPHQSLRNPYTGVLALFASRILAGHRPLLYEDGLQKRSLVNVRDVARAFRLAIEVSDAAGQVFNIGGAAPRTIRDIAEQLARELGAPALEPDITGTYRMGDIRHCFADCSLANRVMGWKPEVELNQGLLEMAGWVERQDRERLRCVAD
jgi:dTDP-L-rhamnose 4-epimerase